MKNVIYIFVRVCKQEATKKEVQETYFEQIRFYASFPRLSDAGSTNELRELSSLDYISFVVLIAIVL